MGQVVQAFYAHRQSGAFGGTKPPDKDREVTALHIFEEQGRATRLDHAVGDLGDFQLAGDRLFDTNELLAALEVGNEGSKVLIHPL